MTMFMNLDRLPAGQSMYTVFVTGDPAGTPRYDVCAEEVDVVTSSQADSVDVVRAGLAEILDLYGPEIRIIGVVNQSSGYVMRDMVMEPEDMRSLL